MKTEQDFADNAHNLTDEERISAFNKNMNDGGFLSRDTVAYGKESKRKWLIAEYEAGDVIFHNPFMVHASCKNKDPENKIRLATDVRFVDPEKPYDKVSKPNDLILSLLIKLTEAKRWMKVYRPLDGL
jgi:phytanoyl-CoA hydroxylase